ncbi:DnaJ domain-containing protein [Blyttiomyces helicus]|uniref:DnaJ domain-containing protein n=1 Tax=Blyttiomyces helicus TaxID=388810 RepID=A0A4P9WH92_9FUNG|nr:DnaJ domain-containing protein [Blyttiomyces helicus]|eukprot:RKO92189.1 DnaJ domain-containing protein [Blyttiomyces helicus]
MTSNAGTVDYYAVLTIAADATDDQIRQAYIKESLKWHPDRNPAPEATERFQEVAQAYFVLSDKDRRTAYDGARRNHQKFGLDESVDPTSVFGNVFDDLLIPEVPNPIWFWQPIGAVAGFAMGFIIFNIPGGIFGAYSGSKMGKVRDMKGVCVYEAFSKLGKERKSEILSSLASKLFSSAL